MALHLLFLLLFIQQSVCLIPPFFQWKTIDFFWPNMDARNSAIKKEDYIPENNMPTGIARWNNKLFITIPRLKKGVPSCLNYVYLNGTQGQVLNPYPSWQDAYLPQKATSSPRNTSVVCAFKVQVDNCNRLWMVDNGVTDLTGEAKQLTYPALVIYDLQSDTLFHRFVLGDTVHRNTSVYTNIVIDIIPGKDKCCSNTFAYISDTGSNAIVVYSLMDDEAWRFENPYKHVDPQAAIFDVGGFHYYLTDGISSAALSKQVKDGFRDMYFHATSTTKQLKISTALLRDKHTPIEAIFNGVQIIGDRGPMSQSSACDYDAQNNVLFYTQLNKNGIGCWSLEKPFNQENTPVILSDCNVMEFPSDIKMDNESNLWMLSNRQSRFFFGKMDPNHVNYRVLTAPTSELIRGTPCERLSTLSRVFSCCNRKTDGSGRNSAGENKSSIGKKGSAESKKSMDSKRRGGSIKKDPRKNKKKK